MMAWITLNSSNISSLNCLFQIITNVFVILSVGFIWWQVRLYRIDYNERIRSSTIEKAAELSKFYAEKIVLPFSALSTYYKAIGAIGVINKIDINKMKEFSYEELKEIVSESEIEEYDKAFKAINPNLIIRTKLLTHSIDYATFVELTNQCKDCSPSDLIFFNGKLTAEFERLTIELLNNLEYFSMNFNDDIADEKTVYQSLHQTFLQISKIAYIRISRQNKSTSDKYYTHIIELFNRWKEIYNEDEAKEHQESYELEERISTLKSEHKRKNAEETRKIRSQRKRAK